MDLLARIDARKEALGLSDREVCRRAGLSASYLARMRNSGAQVPKADQLGKLADALETSVEWLLEGRGPAEAVPGGAEIIDIWSRIPDEKRGVARDLLRTLAKRDGE